MGNNLLVNGRYSLRRVTGVERYAAEVVRRLDGGVRLIRPPERVQGLAGHIWEQVSLPRHVDEDSLLWSPANTGPLKITRQIVTIHDCSPLDHPEWFRNGFAGWYRFLLQHLSRRVSRVITDSEFSRQRILELCEAPEDRVIVIPCGVDSNHFYPRSDHEIAQVRDKYGIPDEYILMVSSINPRKNIQRLLQAWEKVSKAGENILLILAGGGGHHFRSAYIDGLPKGVRNLGYIRESDLPSLYSGAIACIHPSLYEGFGLSVLEAMACGTPVIASNTTALPEVAGDAGLLVDPKSSDSIAEAIATILTDPVTRGRLAQKGLERARSFPWDRTAQWVRETIDQVQNES